MQPMRTRGEKDSGNDVAGKVDEEEVCGGRSGDASKEKAVVEEEEEDGEQAGCREAGRREGRVEGQQSRGNLISACGGF